MTLPDAVHRVPLNTDETLVSCFERVARSHGSRTALVSEHWNFTYEELNVTANRLTHALIARGGRPGDRIAILMEHDAPRIVAMIAILKAGAIGATLNPLHPPARLRIFNRQSCAVALVA